MRSPALLFFTEPLLNFTDELIGLTDELNGFLRPASRVAPHRVRNHVVLVGTDVGDERVRPLLIPVPALDRRHTMFSASIVCQTRSPSSVRP